MGNNLTPHTLHKQNLKFRPFVIPEKLCGQNCVTHQPIISLISIFDASEPQNSIASKMYNVRILSIFVLYNVRILSIVIFVMF